MVSRINMWWNRKQRYRKWLSIHARFSTYTMMDKYLYADNLMLAESIVGLNGDIVECGFWRGDLMAGIASVLTGPRTYYLSDSFEGMPPPTGLDGSAAHSRYKGQMTRSYHDNCTADESFAVEVMQQTQQPFQLVKG